MNLTPNLIMGVQYLAGEVLAQGAVGGVMSELQGGKFGHGFASAGMSAAPNPAIAQGVQGDAGRLVAHAALGGTVSVVAGGKFANGAVTAAFARAFGEVALAGGRGSGPSSGGAATLRRGGSRSLTEGEIAMSEEVFFDDIDYASTRIFNKKQNVFHPSGTAIAPDGNVYFHPDDYLDDFSTASAGTRAWFIHEMTHVWQHQQGMNVLVRGIFDRNYDYLPLVASPPGRSFYSFGIEQQGNIVRDYYLLRQGYQVPGAPPISTYQSVLPFRRW